MLSPGLPTVVGVRTSRTDAGPTPRSTAPRVRFTRWGRPAPRSPFAVVDVETTGLDPRSDRIVEVAVVRCDPTGRAVSEWSTLVDPGRDPGPTGVHGITPADLAGAPRWAEVAGALADQLEGTIVAAHNLDFDLAFLAAEEHRTHRPGPAGPGLCTMALDRALRPGRSEGYSLAACATAAGVSQPSAHRALADARVTAELLRALLTSVPDTGWRPWPRRRLRLGWRRAHRRG